MLFHSSLSVGGCRSRFGRTVDLIEIGQRVKRIAGNGRVASHLELGRRAGCDLAPTVNRGGRAGVVVGGSTEAQLSVSDHETTEGKVGSVGTGRWPG
jgi:hypothetical protein